MSLLIVSPAATACAGKTKPRAPGSAKRRQLLSPFLLGRQMGWGSRRDGAGGGGIPRHGGSGGTAPCQGGASTRRAGRLDPERLSPVQCAIEFVFEFVFEFKSNRQRDALGSLGLAALLSCLPALPDFEVDGLEFFPDAFDGAGQRCEVQPHAVPDDLP